MQAGAIAAAVAALREHPGNVAVAASGCCALRSLGEKAQHKRLAAEAGALEAVLQALRLLPSLPGAPSLRCPPRPYAALPAAYAALPAMPLLSGAPRLHCPLRCARHATCLSWIVRPQARRPWRQWRRLRAHWQR